jgi:hypothetical protein
MANPLLRQRPSPICDPQGPFNPPIYATFLHPANGFPFLFLPAYDQCLTPELFTMKQHSWPVKFLHVTSLDISLPLAIAMLSVSMLLWTQSFLRTSITTISTRSNQMHYTQSVATLKTGNFRIMPCLHPGRQMFPPSTFGARIGPRLVRESKTETAPVLFLDGRTPSQLPMLSIKKMAIGYVPFGAQAKPVALIYCF